MNQLKKWLLQNGWDGYDPYDLDDFLIQLDKKGVQVSTEDQQTIKKGNEFDPMGVREKLNVPKKRIAKGLGLLCAAWTKSYRLTNNLEDLKEAELIAEWLLKNPSEGYQNMCWGYPFDWQSKIFIPLGTPSVVVSTAVGEGLWELFLVTRKDIYLNACISICHFILNDLNKKDFGEKGLCFSYTPIDDFQVHNANLFAGEFLCRVGREIENQVWIDIGLRTADFAISEQNPDGSIFYWGLEQSYHGANHLDHYHTGFEIRCLFQMYKHTGSDKLKVAYQKYLNFYLANFVEPDGLPKGKPNAPYPVNIHGAAEGVLMNALLSPEHPELLKVSEKILKWTNDNLRSSEGWYGHLWWPNRKAMAPYIRWGQAWMFIAMTQLEQAKKIASGEWGYYHPQTDKPGVKAEIVDNFAYQSNLSTVSKKTVNYSIQMPLSNGKIYGSKDWAESLFQNSDKDPWGHDWRASQKTRYNAAIRLLETNQITSCNSILDIGCALGDFTLPLQNTTGAKNVLGVDISDLAIQKCKNIYPQYDWAVSQLPSLNLGGTLSPVGHFDLISALEVIYYTAPSEITQSIQRISDLLSPGGYLLISTYLYKDPFKTPQSFHEIFSNHFEIIDEEIRYHNLYTEIETSVRNSMKQVQNLKEFNELPEEILQKYLDSSFDFLGNVELMEAMNKVSKNKLGLSSASHSIVLARKRV